MSMPTMQADTNPTVPKNNASDPEQELIESLNAAKATAEAETAKGDWIEKASWAMLIMYGVLTLCIGLMTIWGNRQTGRIKLAAGRFNELQMAKITADANRKIALDTQKVREEAATALKLKTEEVRGEAGKKIEEAKAEAGTKIENARAEAGVRIEQARAEAARQIGDVQKDVAQQQVRAANAEAHLAAINKVIVERDSWFDFGKFIESLKGKPKATVILQYQKDDWEARDFADGLFAALQKAGWGGNPPEPYAVSEEYGEYSGAGAGVTIVSNSPPRKDSKFDLNTSFGVLMNAFFKADSAANGWESEKYPEVLRLVVNRRRP